jgi:uncharacterized cofD-like protein
VTRIVAIGGGHGLSRVLLACRTLEVPPTAIVTVADDGGSSGRLRRDLGIIALGDLRMALLALARHRTLADLLGHRFAEGHLQGHALGNLVLLALSEQTGGDVLNALRRAEELLRCEGSVLPSTTIPVQLSASIAGQRVEGQANVTASSGRFDDLWLDPRHPPACPEALDAITAADVVILGPGSLFTSVIANLLVPDVRRAVSSSRARLVHVANVQAPPGESAEMSLADHVRWLEDVLDGRRLDAVIVHDGPPPAGRGAPLRPGRGLAAGRVVAGDLLSRDEDGNVGRAHDPARLAAVLAEVVTAAPASTASRAP